ncbi:MAG: thioredoxin family protein [Ginsengibacter sp.]
MKATLLIFSVAFLFITSVHAQKEYTVIIDSLHNSQEILKGLITKKDLAENSQYAWYAESRKIYPVADRKAVEGMRKNKDNVKLVIFGGTWCEDSHFVLPKLFKIQEESDFPENRMVIYAVDRNKETLNGMTAIYHITGIPTIIVMKNGREVGRVVEFGKTGKWDKEFAEIFSE